MTQPGRTPAQRRATLPGAVAAGGGSGAGGDAEFAGSASGTRPAGSASGTRPAGSASAGPSIGELVTKASEQFSALIRAEIELARSELTGSIKRVGVGAGLFGAAALVLLLSIPFVFVVLAEVLVTVGLPRWAAYLVVWGLFVLVAAALALLGWRVVRRVRKPERTLETVRDTARWARHPTAVEPGTDGTGAAALDGSTS